MTTCYKCGTELPAIDGPGRPRKFCGEVCRKAAGLEVGRLNARIAKLETSESIYRFKGASLAGSVSVEIKRLEGRLAALLAAQEGDAEVAGS